MLYFYAKVILVLIQSVKLLLHLHNEVLKCQSLRQSAHNPKLAQMDQSSNVFIRHCVSTRPIFLSSFSFHARFKWRNWMKQEAGCPRKKKRTPTPQTHTYICWTCCHLWCVLVLISVRQITVIQFQLTVRLSDTYEN